jgi:hypothetical protein
MRNPHFDEKGNFDLDKSIRGLVGALADPIIVMKGFESEPIPDWLRTRIKLERILEENSAHPTGTDAEALLWLMTASLGAPITHDAAYIYGNLMDKEMKTQGNNNLAQISALVRPLTEDQKRQLERLKADIYRDRKKGQAELNQRKRQAAAPAPAPHYSPAAETLQAYQEHYPKGVEPPASFPKRPTEHVQTRKPWMPTGVKMWQIPQSQFISWQTLRHPDADNAEIFQWQGEHRRAVGQALRDKLPVPREVKADYPGLAEHPERGNNPIDASSERAAEYWNRHLEHNKLRTQPGGPETDAGAFLSWMLEAAGDILREASKEYPERGYMWEKWHRIKSHINDADWYRRFSITEAEHIIKIQELIRVLPAQDSFTLKVKALLIAISFRFVSNVERALERLKPDLEAMKPLINPSRVSYNIDICHSLEEAFAKKAELEAKGFWVKSIRGPSNKKEAAQGRALPRYVVEHWVMKRKKKEACR